jgi:ABC-type Na+ efflux pump permease subunit
VRPRKLLRIARWEVTKGAGSLDQRTLAFAGLAVLLVALVGPLAALTGIGLEDGLYRVGVDETSPYHEVVAADDTFVVVEDASRAALDDGSVELLIAGGELRQVDTDKGTAAREAFRDAVTRYNEKQLQKEPNQTAAFPVDVTLDFRDQGGIAELIGAGTGDSPDDGTGGAGGDPNDGTGGTGGDSDDGTGGTGGDSDGGTGGAGGDPDGGTGGAGGDPDGGTGGAGGDPDGGTGGADGQDGGLNINNTTGDDEEGPLGDVAAPISGNAITGSPAQLDAPFPFQSLVLAFLFIIPLNFLIQVYGSTILSERLNRRGELLLVAPVTRNDIIAGKTLPYFLGAMAVETVLAFGLVYLVRGTVGGVLSVLALTPLVLLFLGVTFLGAMFARSFKELTFVTVSITVGLTAYAFVPAIFTDVNEIALISPLTLVVRDLQAEAVALPEVAFSLTPPLLVASVCFALGAGLYREEDMFAQRSIPGRVLDAVVGPVRARWHVGVMTAVLIPFVFVAQLFAIALLFPLDAVGSVAVVLILVVVVITEEIAKSVHVYAAFEHGRFDRGLRTALVLGLASGVGFFIAEKIALLAQLVGLPELAIGEAGLLGGTTVGPVFLLFLLAPLTLHVVTAAISALGARYSRLWYIAAVLTAMVVHFLYNISVVLLVDV